ncbi:MAG: hypothetical protein RIR94_1804 [Bacteroidota bacterium]
MNKKSKQAPLKSTTPKQAYLAPQVTLVQIDHEISLVMASESPFPPPEFLHIKF